MTRLFALCAGLLALPLLALIALMIRRHGAPVFFRQERLGQHGETFVIIKFRTMTPGPGPAITAADDPRLTNWGRRLRRSRLDELPQLWNLLRGDMSLVGPRPEHPRFASDWRRLAPDLLALRPGLTDASTLAFIDEEAALAGTKDPEAAYRRDILPRKLALARATPRNPLAQVRILAATLGHLWEQETRP